jgi:hypothetical protein
MPCGLTVPFNLAPFVVIFVAGLVVAVGGVATALLTVRAATKQVQRIIRGIFTGMRD